ncbi:GNAT family N-acetyltransferase [Flagellimonas meridianipacifica]|uniref:Acetyltransferase (GNAT) family protein n=1 Tax=Flagellimonas meridianipacifica TaxID=1080225 RepID=A0A2T0MCS8_9FLAO|nr:GNAT family N-acetyltransferase [Allomuricauda pacifica]PRX55279.1 acetyltransferase (GNAT) family protein [Allomuricauda pacifica]
MSFKKLHFFIDILFDSNRLKETFSSIQNVLINNTFFDNPENEASQKKGTFGIYDIPDYLLLNSSVLNQKYLSIKFPLYKGFLVNLSEYGNIEDYLNNWVGRARHSQLRRYKKRLDLCISPSYKIFFGDVPKDEYHYLFKKLREFTERRFKEKREDNFEIPFLNLYERTAYEMIMAKRAFLFVIYDEKRPIAITLNYVIQDVVFHWNSCYDIDYSMFNLGHINVMEHIRWCYDNNKKLFDMGRGNFWHKQRWVNHDYMYMEHIYYAKSSFISYVVAHLKAIVPVMRYRLILLLKSLKAQHLYGMYAKFKYRLGHSKVADKDKNTWVVDENSNIMPKEANLSPIRMDEDCPTFLRKSFNSFLHKVKVPKETVMVYQLNEKNNSCYYITNHIQTYKLQTNS